MTVNGGSPVGPGFVVYERERGKPGYDRDMALASVGRGWRGLINELFDTIEFNSEHNPKMGFNDVVIIQVKEKYGTLCVYFTGGGCGCENTQHFSYVEGYIRALENMSNSICEACGNPGRLRDLRDGRSWVLTLCDECQKIARPFELE